MRTILAAFALGLAGDLLLRMTPWGAGAAVWWAAFAATALMWGTGRDRLSSTPLFLLGIAGLVWRASPVLAALDVLVLLTAAGITALPSRGVQLAKAGILRVAGAVFLTALNTVAGFFQVVFGDVDWRGITGDSYRRKILIGVRGTLLAIPLLLVFGALLMSADAQFAALINRVFRFDLADAVAHVFVIAILTALCAGYLRSLAVPSAMPEISGTRFFTLPAPELTIALGLVDALFALFIFVQARYLFGGTATVQGTADLTLANYARRGFFELVAVAILVLPLLLATSSLIDRPSRTFRLIASIQIALVIAIEASAFYRMQLYQREFGWTEDRFYTTAFMFWLAFLLVWFAMTVLRDRGERFLAGVVTTGVIAVFALHVINPDDFIIRTNLRRAASGKRPLDARYATSLSEDSVPALMGSFDALPPHQREAFASRWLRPAERTIPDWRTWNASRRRARRLILERSESLRPYVSYRTPRRR